MEQQNGCLICNNSLVYHLEYRTFTCYFCGDTVESDVSCTGGHYVCDRCHAASGEDLIEAMCNRSDSVDPFELATEIMRSPKIHMHGPEHHFLVPAVLLTAWCNKTSSPRKSAYLTMARKRAKAIPGGFCGSHGNCGAGVGTGVFVSIITGATPLSVDEWQYSNLVTGRCLVDIAGQGGPRCCKRDTYIALGTATDFLGEKFGVSLNVPEIHCEFSERNSQCRREKCLFFDPQRSPAVPA